MGDRSRSRGARQVLRILLLTVAVFVLWRFLGPGVAVVRDDSLAPILENGDIVWIRPVRGELNHGAVVLLSPFFSTSPGALRGILDFSEGEDQSDRRETLEDESPAAFAPRPDGLVPRIITGLAGDEVTWTDTSISVVGSDGSRFQLSPDLLHPLLRQEKQSISVPDGSFFTVSLSGGMVDSRLIGPRTESAVRYQVSRIIWPRERRGAVAPVESGRNTSR